MLQVIEEKLTLLHIIATHDAFISGRRSRAMYAGLIKVRPPSQPRGSSVQSTVQVEMALFDQSCRIHVALCLSNVLSRMSLLELNTNVSNHVLAFA